MATATLGSMRCDAQTTRRIVEREAGQMKNMDLDKLDNCGEVTLGLGATFGCTIFIWIVGLNFFNMVGLQWVRSWEPVQFDFFKGPILDTFPADGDGVPQGAFAALDSKQAGYGSQEELKTFLNGLKHPNLREHEVSYAFKGMDANKDGKLSQTEWVKAFTHNTFWWQDTTTTTTMATTQQATTQAPKLAPLPEKKLDMAKVGKAISELMHKLSNGGKRGVESAFGDLDLNNDGFSAHGEMIKALSQMHHVPSGVSTSDLFHGLDSNGDSALEFAEFKNAFQASVKSAPKPAPKPASHEEHQTHEHEEAGKEVVHVKVGHQPSHVYSNPRVAQVLKEMGLSEPPLTMSRFAHGMGSVPPETAFRALDSDQDGEISEAEMVKFAKAFVPPLTKNQAMYAYRGMDIDDDGRVVPAEMYDTLRFGEFFPTEKQAREIHQ